MIIDKLSNADRYAALNEGISKALHYLNNTDLINIEPGKYLIEGDRLFAIVQEYDTIDSVKEQMESHRNYIDVQYMITGAELVGHSIFVDHQVSKEYSPEEDYMLYAAQPDFFTQMATGTFMVFYPTDLHMPCIKIDTPQKVKKVVVKVAVNW